MTGITIEAALLARAMKNAAAIVQSAQTIPILANVRLFAEGDVLELTTTDLDTEYRQRLPLAAPGQIGLTVEAKRLRDLAANAAPGSQMALAPEDATAPRGRLIAKAGRARWVMPTMPVGDFPPMPTDQLGDPVTLPGKALADGLKRIAWAAGTEVSRPWYMGIYLYPENARARIVAADGNIAIASVLGPDGGIEWPKAAPPIILPSRFVGTLISLAAEADAVTLAWDDRKLRAELGEIVLTGKVIDGAYPNVLGTIVDLAARREELTALVIDPAGLRAALRRVELGASDKSSTVRVTPREGLVEISMRDDDGRHAAEELPADAGDTHETGFNCRYLGQMIEAIGGDTLTVHQEHARSPALFARTVDDGTIGILGAMSI